MMDKVIAEPPMGARPRTGSSHHLHPHRRSLDHGPSMRRLAYCTPVLDQLVVKGITTPACVLLGGGLVVQHSHHREAGEQAENGRRAGLHRNGQHRCDNDRARQCSQRALHPRRNPHATSSEEPRTRGCAAPGLGVREDTDHDTGAEGYPRQARPAGAGQAARQREPSLQD